MGILRQLSQIPLFQRLVLANLAIVALGAFVGTTISLQAGHSHTGSEPRYDLILLFTVSGTALSAAVQLPLLRRALCPIGRLEHAAQAIREGRLDVRVSSCPFSDPQLDRLIETFNQMAETLASQNADLHRLPQQIIQAQEEERARVARELHDETAQLLTSLLIGEGLLARSTPPDLRPRIEELQQMTSAALEEVRRIALELRPALLADLGLVAALRWQVEEFQRRTGIAATLSIKGLQKRLPREVELALYRVTQESLTNVARHARGRRVDVLLTGDAQHVDLKIADDGVGFDAEHMLQSRRRGLGLSGMLERLSVVGGNLDIRSAPGQGTTIHARVPLEAPLERTG